MKGRTAVCPACGGPIEFQASSSLVGVCEFCNSAIARSDRKLEDFGKIADLTPTQSPLQHGMTGRFSGKPFTVVGRVQYSHAAGGVWDEWYLSFPGNRWGWLSEAQGKRHLMFERRLNEKSRLPDYERLEVGGTVRLGKSDFTVAEKGIAKNASAEGDIPWAFRPGGEHRYADLSGPDNTFATFEYGENTRAFVGREVSLADLGLDDDEDDQGASLAAGPDVAALLLNCPKCGGPLTLHAPDKTERMTCGNCNSLLDASGGKLEYFATLKHAEKLRILIPIGSTGTLNGHQYTVIGFMRRFALYEGKTYPWSEYLLYGQQEGFRWLVHNERHWSFVEPLPPHAVSKGFSEVRHNQTTYSVYDRGTAYVRSVAGEFYWRVEVGETVRTADYIAPPNMISFETLKTDKSEEINVSLGTYVTVDEIEQAFGLKELPRPWGVGVIEPKPNLGFGVFVAWGCFLVVLLMTHIVFSKPGAQSGSDVWLMLYGMVFVSLIPAGIVFYLHNFEVRRWQNSDYSPYASSE